MKIFLLTPKACKSHLSYDNFESLKTHGKQIARRKTAVLTINSKKKNISKKDYKLLRSSSWNLSFL